MRALFLLLLLANLLLVARIRWVAPPATTIGRATPVATDPQAIRLLREAPLARELAKSFEEVLRGTAAEVRDALGAERRRGEMVLVLSGRTREVARADRSAEESGATARRAARGEPA